VLSTVLQTPRTEQRLRKNPLGIYVNGLSWSRELDSSEGDVMDASLPTGKSIAAGARR